MVRKLVFAAAVLCLTASGTMAEIRNCATLKATRARLACLEANQQELEATLAALMSGVEIRAMVGGDMAPGNPWCLMIKSGVNATVAKNCVVLPGEYASVKWQLVPAR